MKLNMELGTWIKQNNGYSYYLNPRFLGAFSNCEIRYMNNMVHIDVLYDNYSILNLAIEDRGIFLTYKENNNVEELVQKKLTNEYVRFFNLKERPFRITQYNMFFFIQYMDTVRGKIDAGFEKYSKLLEENIKAKSLGQLLIGIDNVFSLGELEKLIDAYNRLYSIVYYACEHGVNDITERNIHNVETEHNMVLESIHIGSEGLLVSVGAGLIVEIVKAFVKSVYAGNKIEAEREKNELAQRAQMEADLHTRKCIFELIELLDSYLEKRDQHCRPGTRSYIENEINRIVITIEQLQGTPHIDVLV